MAEDAGFQPQPLSAAQRALNRGAGLARVSGLVLIIAGSLSVLVSLLHPLSVGMLISVLVLGNGVIEWRFARRLRELQPSAAGILALNQLALGFEIGLYALWRGFTFDGTVIEQALQQPMVQTVLDAYPPEQVEQALALLPPLIRGAFIGIGLIAALGCVIMAIYYRSRRKYAALLAAESSVSP